jgi:hypothetical protein
MKQIAITSLAVALGLSASAQENVKPLMPNAPPIPPVVKSFDLPLPPEAPLPPELPAQFAEATWAPVPTTEELSDDYKEFLKRNPTVRSLGWTKKSVIVKLKNGKEEQYDLSNEEIRNQAENKYGEFPPPPPPPPVAPPPPPKAPAKTKG